MKNYKVIIASTIYYEAVLNAKSEEDIEEYFDNGAIDFTEWKEIDLDSHIYDIVEVK